MIVTSNTDKARWALFLFLKERGVELSRSEDFQAIGRINKELAILGVVGYNSFCGSTCAMHVAGIGNWMSRELIRAAFDYPFRQLGMVQIFACTALNNARALRLERRIGFKPLLSIPNGWGAGVGLEILGMHKSECRWLEKIDALKAA